MNKKKKIYSPRVHEEHTYLCSEIIETMLVVVVVVIVWLVEEEENKFTLHPALTHSPTVCLTTNNTQVYLYGGEVHVIPQAQSPASLSPLPTGTPAIMDAVSTVRRLPEHTRASPEIQETINARVSGYPNKIAREQHVTHAYVPVAVAALLREYPTLVGPAVHAFANKEYCDSKVLRMMRHFPPETRVMTAVRMSKASYARLLSTRYTPDTRTGWAIPHPTHQDFKSHDIGMKLACGLELLVSSAGGITPTSASSPSQDMDLDFTKDNPAWLRYKQSLADKGYFRGELEGSKLYQELETGAQQYFITTVQPGTKRKRSKDQDNIDNFLPMGAMVVKLLAKVNIDHEFYRERSTRLVPADDDSWLQITPDALEEMLEEKFGKDTTPRPASDGEVMHSLSAFLGHMSDLEGAEVPKDLQDQVRKLSTLSTAARKKSRKPSAFSLSNHHLRKVSAQSTASDCSEVSNFSTKIDFNADSFTDAMANILESGVPDDNYWGESEDESSGMSSYGEEEDDGAEDKMCRKSSNTSQRSAESGSSSSGVDLQMKEYMQEMERELANTKLSDTLVRPPSATEEAEDEFNDVEDFAPVKVDMRAVQDLVKTYTAQNGLPGPASSLLGSMGIKPKDV
ncbi:hypothetical protein Pcinc_037405 [Petrolisthes cinctipes]|uniref:Uncharacterized protein n=1 Tax=Petrolisthes cinctipes TaxID=88211 RepID=A0AAE1BTL3_PETCI|nr:hypothetical protein Pcinc_037405 [Petrolisthes cinctipes]